MRFGTVAECQWPLWEKGAISGTWAL